MCIYVLGTEVASLAWWILGVDRRVKRCFRIVVRESDYVNEREMQAVGSDGKEKQ